MESAVNVVVPVFGLIALGYAAGKLRLLGSDSSEALNKFVYWFALPALLFLAMARVPIGEVANLPFVGAFMGGVLVVSALAVAVGRVAFPDRPAVLGMGGLNAIFANTGYMGIPLFLTAVGPEGTLPAIIATVLNSAVVIGGAVVLIELDLSTRGGVAGALADVASALLRNPLVTAPVLGLAAGAAGLPIPRPLASLGDLLGAAAGPSALFAIGLFLSTRSLATLVGGRKTAEVAWLIGLKLVVQPLVTWGLARAAGLDAFWVASATILAALPTGALAFVIATQYRLYVERTSAVILGSTVLSAATLAALLAGLGPLAP